MADGSVNIDIMLNSDQAVAERNKIDGLLKTLGEGAGDKIEPSIQSGLNKAQQAAGSAHQQIVDQFGKPIKMPIDDSDTKKAEEKAKKLGETYESIPKHLRTELIADARDHGIANMDKLLRGMPRELRTELIAKAQKGEAIDYERLLHRLPTKLLTQLNLTDNASPKLRMVQEEAQNTQRQFTGLHDIIKGTFIGGLFAQGTAMISGALANTAHEALGASDAIDKFKSTMKLGGFGNAEINRQAKEVQKYANDTVYDLNTISNTTAQLASNGVKGYMKLTEAAGNLNAQAGGTADTFRSVAMVLTQTAGAGKLTTENWNQLTDAIPGASGVLQEQMRKNGAFTGNFRDAMAKGEITADEFNKAISQLGMNKGAVDAAKSTTTFEGAFGNLQAQVVTGIQEMIQALGKRRMTDMINTATDAVLGLTKFTLALFSAIAEHKNIAIGLGAVLAGVFATKKIADFIMWLGKAKEAMVTFGLASQAANVGTPGATALPAASSAIAGGSRLASLASFGGRAVPVAAATYAVGTELTSKASAGQKIGGSVGAVGGAFGGRALGGAIGTMIAPGIGTAVGQMLGGALGTWAGNKLGDAIGKAANKHMQGHSIVAHAKIKLDSDTEGTSKAIRPDLNKVARTVIKMSIDPKSIADTKQKTDKLYSDMRQSLKKYYSDKEARSKKNLQELVKEGVITQQQANKKLQAEKRADDARLKQEQRTISTMQKDTNRHYKKLENIENGGTKKLEAIAKKYGKDSKKYNQERIREVQKENQRYTKVLVQEQMKADKKINASAKKGASQQQKIYKDLIKKKGKLSKQDLKQTQRDANKQYQAAVKPAKKAYNEIVKAANDKYKKTVKAAEHEYKDTHTISRKQYKEIVADAKGQREDTTKEADRQYKGVTKKATDQHKKVSKEIEGQKNDVNRSAMNEATGHISAAQTEMQGVNSNYSSGYSRSGGIWNKFLNGVKSVLKFFRQSTRGVPSVPTGYAQGTGALTQNQLAMVGEEGPELANTPNGYEMLGVNGPEIRYLSAGTSILTHAQTKAAMALNGGRMPGYAKGTGAKIEDFVDGLKDGAEDALDLLGKGTSEVWDWLKQKTGLDHMLGSQSSYGGVKRTTHGTFDYAKSAIGKYVKKMADKFLESFGGGGGKMSKGAFAEAAKVAAALMHQSLSSADIEHLYWQALTESTVNPAQNGGYDDHDGTGLPIGLFQFKLSTWNSAMRHVPGNHHNIHSAVDQIMAVLADSTWRSDFPPVGVKRGWTPHGYANGGWADKFSIFGEVPGEPEVAINPKRDTSEEHIAEAIEARAKVNPNGFAGTLSKLIESAKNSANNLVPVINQGTSQVRTASSVASRSVKIDGNLNVVMNVDGKTIGHVTYATWRAIRSHEVNIQAKGGAIPVGGAQPLGGVY